jgi:hypothetical protein
MQTPAARQEGSHHIETKPKTREALEGAARVQPIDQNQLVSAITKYVRMAGDPAQASPIAVSGA